MSHHNSSPKENTIVINYQYSDIESNKFKRQISSTSSRLNNIIKALLININILLVSIGFTLIAFALYLIFVNWGVLEQGFFLGPGIILMLIGIFVALIAILGCQTINRQNEKYGFWTGRKMILTYQTVIVILLVIEFCLINFFFLAAQDFDYIVSTIPPNSLYPSSIYPNYVSFESSLAYIFNNLFYGAINACGSSNQIYPYFWDFVNDHCPKTISQQNCQSCYSYSITTCEADEQTCDTNDYAPYNYACPYNICRTGILNYYIELVSGGWYNPVIAVLTSFMILQLLIFVLNGFFGCYTPKDSIEVILEKSGIVAVDTNLENVKLMKKKQKLQKLQEELDQLDSRTDDDINNEISQLIANGRQNSKFNEKKLELLLRFMEARHNKKASREEEDEEKMNSNRRSGMKNNFYYKISTKDETTPPRYNNNKNDGENNSNNSRTYKPFPSVDGDENGSVEMLDRKSRRMLRPTSKRLINQDMEQSFDNIYSANGGIIPTSVSRSRSKSPVSGNFSESEDNPLRNNKRIQYPRSPKTGESKTSTITTITDEKTSSRSKHLKQYYVTPDSTTTSPRMKMTYSNLSNNSSHTSNFDKYNTDPSPVIYGLKENENQKEYNTAKDNNYNSEVIPSTGDKRKKKV